MRFPATTLDRRDWYRFAYLLGYIKYDVVYITTADLYT